MTRATDPVLLEVVRHELAAATEEITIAVCRTARSPMIRVGDFGAAICDANGHVVGAGYLAPFALGSFMETMASVVARHGQSLRLGDVILTNDPYSGSGHLPDVAVVAPIFWHGQLVAYSIIYTHHTDIGGRFPGGFSSQATTIYEEGVRLPLVKLYSAGKRNDELVDLVLANVRRPEDWLGDLDAKLSGCWRGDREVRAVLDRYGLEAFLDCCRHLNDYSELLTREAIEEMPDGIYTQESTFADDGFGNSDRPQQIRVTITVRGSNLEVDYTGTSAQAPSGINLPFGWTRTMTYGALRILVGEDAPTNVGFTRPFIVTAPEGSLLNPRFPAAVGGRAALGFNVNDALYRALAQARPDRIGVVGEGGDIFHWSGVDANGASFIGMDAFFGGWGGRPRKDGIDGCATIHFGSYGTAPLEMIEREYPVVSGGFGLVPDTGGAGTHRGALSTFREWTFLAPAKVMVRTNRINESLGLAGGQPGALASTIVRRADGTAVEMPRQTHLHLDLSAGDTVYHAVSGCGGHGPPAAREGRLVSTDVREGKVSAAVAREVYRFGVGRKGVPR